MGLPSAFFAKPDDQVRIDFGDGPMAGSWISIRRRISDLEGKRLALGMFKGMKMDGGKATSMEADATLVDFQKLRLWVQRWGAAGEAGTKPTTQELTGLLPEHAAQILKAIADHEASVTEGDALDTDPLLATIEGPADDGLTDGPADSLGD